MMNPKLRVQWLDRLLPSSVGERDPSIRFRANLVFGFALFGLVVLGLSAVSEIVWGIPLLGWVLVLCTLLMGPSLYLLRQSRVDVAALWLTAVMLAAVTVANFGSGGRALGANMALPILIMFSILVLSNRGAIIATGLMLVEIVVVAMLRHTDLHFPLQPDPDWVQSAIDRMPLFMSLGAAAIGFLTRNALTRYREELRSAQSDLAALNQRNALILETALDGILFIDRKGVVVFANPSSARLLGYSVGDLVGRDAHATLHQGTNDGASHPVAECPIHQTLHDGSRRSMDDESFRHVSGHRFHVHYSVAATRDAQGGVVGAVLIFQDITTAKKEVIELAANEKRLSDLIEYSRGLMCTHALDGKILSLNPAAANALGYQAAELVGCNLVELVLEQNRPFFDDYLAAIMSRGWFSGRFQLVKKDGSECLWEFNNIVCQGLDGVPYVLGSAVDVTERRMLESRLREQNIRDPLTGCFNRRYLAQRESELSPGMKWGCIVVDLDHFKQINDSEGHRRGDEVLQAVGRFLSLQVREGDDVIRMGGDEFLLFLPGADASTTRSIAARIGDEAIAALPCCMSIGNAAREGEEPLEKTIDRADKELYRLRFAARGFERRSAPAH